MRNEKCWASSLEDCSEKISGEHIISASLFPEKSPIDISGMSWLKGRKAKIPVARLTSNILCTHHNSITSPLDTEAGQFFNVFDKIAKDFKNVGGTYNPERQKYVFNGHLIERWMLKTLINLWKSESLDNEVPLQASIEELVPLVFGTQKFPGKSGLYLIAKVGMPMDTKPELGIQTIIHSGKIVAALFEFRSFLFVLWLIETEMPHGDELNLGQNKMGLDPCWHYKEIKIIQGLFPPKIIDIQWQ